MSQVTSSLEPELAKRMTQEAQEEESPKRKWIARWIEDRLARSWPECVRQLAGARPDFVKAEELRQYPAEVVPHETL
ncbi:MAG TPA: hypothetical protein VF171_03745 [Trueperaceae bacterium]